MKMSNLFMPTIRELPSDAEVTSHILMLRAAMIRQVTSGSYCYLPLGYRVLRKVEQVIREEMDKSGALELHMPALLSSDLFRESGRWDVFGASMFKLKDRNDRDMCLGPTHEELFTDLVRSWIHSYKNLPITLYQIQTKFRDEPRPRYGVIRSKEFIMKDAYSFDVDEEGLDISYNKMYKAYCAAFDRLGLKYMIVDADSGAMGGSGSQEYMVLSPIGEDDIVYCDKCRYAANVEKATFKTPVVPEQVEEQTMEKIYTPGFHTIAQISEFLKVEANQVVKTLIYLADGKPVAAMLRGDRDLNELKFQNFLGCADLIMADPYTVRDVTHSEVGYAGPVGLEVPIYADTELRGMQNMVVGANETDYHLRGVNLVRDYNVTEFVEIRKAISGDACPVCGEPMQLTKGVEVGHIFKLGRKYTEALNCTYTTADGKEDTPIMGCYGIGVTRVVAAIIEQSYDDDGIIWPKIVAPYHAVIVGLGKPESEEMRISEDIYTRLVDAGVEALYDDRNERAGVKFKDADLIGIPVRLTVGRKAKDGIVELKYRNSKDVRELPIEEAIKEIKAYVKQD
ncbi:MAG: proline--tRNA ligase [Clostridiales bacterium]|nr:proline--tRNA ligase [Clostridiales bacterium]